MNDKYSLKIIQHGKTQQVRTVQHGAGIAGQAVVIQATDAARYQLVNVVTLVSPTKLQLKRVGDALHLVLPGGDLDAPDLVIQDYFKVTGASLQGSSISGEWMNYDTAGLATNPAPSVAGTDTLSSSVVDKASNVSLGGEGVLGTFTEHPWLWAGGIAGAAAAGGGGGGGGTTPTGDTSPLGVVQAYANGGSTTAPTTAQYTSIGLTLPTIAGLTAANVLSAMNAVVASKNSTDVATLAQLQTLADNMNAAYIKILAEANGATVDATPSVDPTLADYASVGVIMGTTTQTLALMNSALGEKVATGVDSVDKLKAMATASDDVMKVAAGTAGAAITYTDLLVLGLKINGANSGITAVQAAALQANLANLESSLGLAESLTTGAAVNTFAKVQALLSLQVMRSFSDDTAAIGSKSQTAPGVSDYTNVGIKSYASLSSTANASRVDLTDANFSTVAGFSLQTTLNSALDKLSAGTSLTKAGIQSMVDSYYRILKEADGSTTSNTDVYADTTNDATNAATYNDPTATDYDNIGLTKVDGTKLSVASTLAAPNNNTEILALLNDAVGRFSTASVDTVAELSALEKAAENIMAIGAGTGTGLATTGVTYTTDAEWIAGFTALGVTGVTTANLAAVKKAIDAADVDTTLIPAGTPIDTVQELLDLVKPEIALQVLVDYTNTNGGGTVPTLSTYTDVGIKTFKSLLDTGVSNRKALNDSSTASGAESNTFLTAAILNTALDKLAGTSLTYDATYTGTVQKMVDSYYRILREADGKYIGDSNGGATYYNNFDVAHTADTDVYNDSTNDGTNATNYNDPTLGDYANIGITVADAISTTAYTTTTAAGNETLDLLNDAIGRMSTASVDTAGEIETLAITANDVMSLAKVDTVVAGVNTAPVITANVAAAASQTDANLITGLNNLLGLNTSTGVNTANLAAVKAAIAATADLGTDVNTADKLLGVLTLVRLSEFTDDGGTFYVSSASNTKTTLTPTLNDWTLAGGGTGVLANTSLVDGARISLNQSTYWKTTNAFNGLNALNSALDTYDKSLVNQTLLQNIVDAYGRVLQEADGSRATSTDVKFVDSVAGTGRGADVTQADLAFLGVNKGGDTDNATTYGTAAGQGSGLNYQKTGELLASAIGSLSSTSVDTLYELNNLTGYAEAVMKHAAGIVFSYTDSEWVTALNSLLNTNTVTGVNTNNIADIKSAIDTVALAATDVAAVDTWDELQAIVSLVRLDDYAALSTGWTTPTITDYQSVAFKNADTAAYTGVKSAYLGAYNDAVNSQTTVTEVGVKDMVAKYTLLLDSADSSRLTAGTNLSNTDFAKIWGVSVASANEATLLNDVINGLATSSLDQVSELIALATTANKIVTLSGGTAQGISRQELANLGLNDGAGHSFTDINSGTGTYWITDAEYGRFTSTTGLGSIGDGPPSTINTWQQLQDLVSQAIINA